LGYVLEGLTIAAEEGCSVGRTDTFFGEVADTVGGETRILRVVTLADGETVHNAFFDRGYREQDK
jgi:hypothetical protein